MRRTNKVVLGMAVAMALSAGMSPDQATLHVKRAFFADTPGRANKQKKKARKSSQKSKRRNRN